MAKQYKVLVNTANAADNVVLEVPQAKGGKVEPLRITAKAGQKYQLQELSNAIDTPRAPDYVKSRRVGKDLHIVFEDEKEASVIIEDYYDAVAEGANALIGQAENGSFYDYIPEDPQTDGLVANLSDGGEAINVALGGTEVQQAGAAIGLLAGTPLLGLLGLAGAGAVAAAAAAANNGTTTTSATGRLAPVAPNDSSTLGDNLTNDNTPTITGTVAAGSTATMTLNGKTYPVTVNTDGTYSFTIPDADKLPDGTYTPKLNVTTNGTTTSTDVTPFTIDTITNVAISNPGTGGTANPISGTAEAGDVVVVKDPSGNTLGSTTANSAGQWSFTPTSAIPNGNLSATATDAAGNTANATGNNTTGNDTTPPTIAITRSATGSLTGTATDTITFTLSESSTNFVLSDVDVTGGSLSNFAGSGTVYTAIFTPNNGSGTATIGVDSDKFSDAAGNTNKDTYKSGVTGATQESNNQLSIGFSNTNTVDTTPPTIAVTTDKASLATGQTATISFALSESSTDFTAADVTVIGGTLSNFQGSGTSYTATFTPTAGASSAALVVDSSKFSDAASNFNKDGAETNNSVSMSINNTPADTTPPTIAVSTDKTSLASGQTATITFTLSESSTDFTAADVTVVGGTLSNFQGSGTAYTATFTPTAGATSAALVVDSDKFSDAAGNFNKDGADANNTVSMSLSNTPADNTPPTIAVSSDKTSLSSNQTATITFTLSETSTDFSAADVTVIGGTLSNFQGSGTAYTATFTPTAGATSAALVVDTNKFSDAAGNFNKDGADANNSVSMSISNTPADTTPPTIAVSSDKATLASGQTATITFSLSESSTDFTAADVTVIGGTISNFQGSGTSYTATFTPTSGASSAALTVSSDKFSDATGNLNKDGSDTNNSVSMSISNTPADTTAPTISVSSDKSSLTSGQTATITFTLSESSTDFTASDVTVIGGTLSNFQGSGTSYTATFTPTAGTTSAALTVSSDKFSDAAGNLNKDGSDTNNSVSMSISNTPADTTAPTISVSSDKSSLSSGQTATITFTLSESSTDFTASDVTVIGGTLSNFQGSGTSYTATFTPTSGATSAALTVSSEKFSDAAGNLNKDGSDTNNSVSMSISNTPADTTPPTISVSTDKATLASGQTATITFTLSESSTDFTTADVTVVGGTLSNFQGSGTSYTATFTPNAGVTSAALTVSSDKFSDAAGNLNKDGSDTNNSVSMSISNTPADTTAPTISVSTDKSTLASGQTATITFTLSESSTDFTASDVTVIGGTLSNFTGSGTSYTATFTPNVGVTSAALTVSSDKFSDAAGNLNKDGSDTNNSVSMSISNTPADTTPPTISVSTDKSTLASGQTATITFTLSESSTDFTAADVTVIGGTLSNFQGSGTSYTATFTPTAGVTSTALTVSSDKFSDAAGNLNKDGSDTNNSVSMSISNTPADTTAPTISVSTDKSTLASSQTATITFTLSESSTDFTASDVTVIGGTLSNFQGSGTSYTATFTPTAGVTSAALTVSSDKFSDAAGNLNKDGSDTNNSVSMSISNTPADTTPPTISVSTDKSTLASGQTATITFTLSESSTDFTAADVTVIGGTLSNFQGSGTSYTATFTPTAGTTSAALTVSSDKFSDAAGNLNKDGSDTNNSVSMSISNTPADTTAPTIAVSSDKATLASGQTATITFTLSESSTDFTAADVTVIGGTLSNFQGSGTSYTATFTPTAGTTSAALTVSSDKFSDAAGNLNKDGSDTNNSVSMSISNTPADTTAPTIAVSSDKATLASGQTATITFTLSESSTDFTAADVTVIGGTLSNFQGSGTSYTATFTPTSGATSAALTVASDKFSDAAGNLNKDGSDTNNSVSMSISNTPADTTAPTIAVSSDKATLASGQTATITFTLSESSTDFTAADVTVIGGTLSNFQGSGTSYTATFTPTSGATSAALTVASDKFSDAAGNLNKDGSDTNNSVSMSISNTPADTTPPTITVSTDKSTLASGQTATITFTLSESSTDFTASDVTVIGGTLSNFQGSGTSYTATFTPTSGATSAALTVASDKFSDAAGNLNKDGSDTNNSVSMSISNTPADTTPPTIAVSTDKSTLASGQTATITFTLSESSTDFTASDVTVIGGTLSNFQGSGTSYTATFTPTSGATSAALTVASDKFSDAAGNLNKDGSDTNNSVSMSISNTPPDTTAPTIALSSDKTSLSVNQTATITFTLSESSVNFTASDVTVVGGTLSNFQGGGTDYTATFTPNANATSAAVIVASDRFTDAAANLNKDGADLNNTVSLTIGNTSADTTAPTISVSTDKSTLASGQTANITFTLSESSTNFTAADVTLIGGTLSNFQGSGTSYTATFTPTSGATSAALTVGSDKFSDASGNFNKDGGDVNNSVSMNISNTPPDTTAPTITISSDKTSLSSNQTASMTFTLSESSTDFTAADVTVIGGTLSNFQGSGTSYTATFTPTSAVTSAALTVSSDRFSDAAGNLNKDGAELNNTVSLRVDSTPSVNVVNASAGTTPTVAITRELSSGITIGSDSVETITFTFSEAPVDFDLTDISVTNGSVSNLQAVAGTGDTVYTAVFSPILGTQNTATIGLAANKIHDATGNANLDTFDTTATTPQVFESNNQVTIDYMVSTPLVLDLNGDGVQTVGAHRSVQFDLLNTGTAQTINWVDRHDGILVRDLNQDGVINSGAELFGDHTQLPNGSLTSDGWAALQSLDSNGDQLIDQNDKDFNDLRLWVDGNGNALTEAGELRTLTDLGVQSISLNHDNASVAQNGNVLQGFSKFTTTDGQQHEIVDVFLGTGDSTAAPQHFLWEADSTVLNLQGMQLHNCDNIDLTSTAQASAVKINLAQVLDMGKQVASDHMLVISGKDVDTTQLTDALNWDTVTTGQSAQALNKSFGSGHGFVEGQTYTQLQQAGATLFIDETMHQVHHA